MLKAGQRGGRASSSGQHSLCLIKLKTVMLSLLLPAASPRSRPWAADPRRHGCPVLQARKRPSFSQLYFVCRYLRFAMSCEPQHREQKVTSTWCGSPTSQRQCPWGRAQVWLPAVSNSLCLPSDSCVYMRERWKMAQKQVGTFMHIRLGWKTIWKPVQEAPSRSRHFLISLGGCALLSGRWRDKGQTEAGREKTERTKFLDFRNLTFSALQSWILFENQKYGKILATL